MKWKTKDLLLQLQENSFPPLSIYNMNILLIANG
jgi:hypothetical protein